MLNRHDIELRERSLDACIDRLVSGGDWQAELPGDPGARSEVLGLLAVASRLVEVAGRQPAPATGMKQRVWQRVSTSPEMEPSPGLLTRLTGIRIPYRRPPQPSLVHRMLFARIPYLPPIVLDYREAS